MESMTTLSEILNKLRYEGYTEDFNLNTDSIHCNDVRLNPNDFVVDRHFRFEGASDPEDEAVVYAISSVDGKIKGVLVNSYGANSDTISDELVKALRERKDL
jgi:hypothetical protein